VKYFPGNCEVLCEKLFSVFAEVMSRRILPSPKGFHNTKNPYKQNKVASDMKQPGYMAKDSEKRERKKPKATE